MPDERWYGWLTVLVLVALVALQLGLTVSVLLRPQRRQSSSLAWILVILLLPVIGIVAWLLFGEVRLGRERVRKLRAFHQEIGPFPEPPEVLESLPPHLRSLAKLGATVCGSEVRPGNRVRLVNDTDQVIELLAADVLAAKRSVHLLFYIWLTDANGTRLAEAVEEAARSHVACRVLVDALGSREFLDSDWPRRLRAAGAEVVAALPPRLLPGLVGLTGRVDLRNHRKIAVIDGHTSWTGSQNVADAAFAPKAAYAPWVDAMLRIEGPASLDLQQLFVEDWHLEREHEHLRGHLEHPLPVEGGVPMQVMGTGPGSRNDALVQVLQAAFQIARHEIVLTTPYFVPDEGTLAALCTADLRGVTVHLVVPRRNDSPLVALASRSFYEPLLNAGVRVHEFEGGLLHAKTISVDGELAYVGSANLDRRSFEINFEVSTLVYDRDLTRELRALQEAYMASSVRIDPERWARRSRTRRLLQNASGLLGPLL